MLKLPKIDYKSDTSELYPKNNNATDIPIHSKSDVTLPSISKYKVPLIASSKGGHGKGYKPRIVDIELNNSLPKGNLGGIQSKIYDASHLVGWNSGNGIGNHDKETNYDNINNGSISQSTYIPNASGLINRNNKTNNFFDRAGDDDNEANDGGGYGGNQSRLPDFNMNLNLLRTNFKNGKGYNNKGVNYENMTERQARQEIMKNVNRMWYDLNDQYNHLSHLEKKFVSGDYGTSPNQYDLDDVKHLKHNIQKYEKELQDFAQDKSHFVNPYVVQNWDDRIRNQDLAPGLYWAESMNVGQDRLFAEIERERYYASRPRQYGFNPSLEAELMRPNLVRTIRKIRPDLDFMKKRRDEDDDINEEGDEDDDNDDDEGNSKKSKKKKKKKAQLS